MDLAFESTDLEAVCTQDRVARKKYDAAMVKGLQRRIKQIQAAVDVQELLDGLGKWHWLGAQFPDCLGGHITGNWRLIVRPDGAGPKDPTAKSVRAVEIIDYH